MTNQHLITPPPELVLQWRNSLDCPVELADKASYIATQAAQWGADQELEACCDHIHTLHGKHRAEWLHDIRRPTPPSLKEQALAALDQLKTGALCSNSATAESTIRRALEALDD